MIKEKVTALFSAIKAVFSEMKVVPTDKGNLYYEDELKVGAPVYTDGGIVESGIFISDNAVIEVSNGIVIAISEKPVEEIAFGSVDTDKAILSFEGDELHAGMPVYVDGKAATDGEYATPDGKIIKVVGGIVESIVDPVAEVDAIEGMGCVKKNFAEEKIEENPEEEKPIEEKEGEIPVEYISKEAFEKAIASIDEFRAGIEAALEEIKDKITAIDSRITDVEGKPEGGMPHDEFSKITKSVNDDYSAGIEAIKAMRESMRIK